MRKYPGRHFEHAVPFVPVVHPALQIHCPFDPHAPFKQLHDAGASGTSGARHLPEPEMPWSQEVQLAGHGRQDGPKKPEAHDSHDAPVNPCEQAHVPRPVQMPALEHGGEQAVDLRLKSVKE